MAPDLSKFDADNEALAVELVSKIDRVIRLAESEDFMPAEDHQAIINDGRQALVEIAAFFDVVPPQVSP